MDMSASSVASLDMDVDTLSDKSISIGQSDPLTDIDILSNASESEQQSEEALAFVDCDSEARSDRSSSGLLFEGVPGGLSPAPCAISSQWVPGSNVTPWISRGAPIGEQAQVLVVNVVASLLQVPGRVVSTFLRDVDVGKAKSSKVFQVSADLLGMSISTVRSVYLRVRSRSWKPLPPKCARRQGEVDGLSSRAGVGGLSPRGEVGGLSPTAPTAADVTLRNVIRVALANSLERKSHEAFVRELHRHRLAGANVGVRYADRRFSEQALAMASLVLQQLDAYHFNDIFGGLGIPSDFSVLADPVSIGLTAQPHHDVLLVVCLSIASSTNGVLYSPMFSAIAMPFSGHSGNALVLQLFEALSSHAAAWGKQLLRARVASVCGDGGLTSGGPEHRHSSTAAAEKFWKELHGGLSPVCTFWDSFHRCDVAAWRAIRAVPVAAKVFDVVKDIDAMFGQSEGYILYRGVAEMLGEASIRVRAPGKTRKIVYLSGSPGSLAQSFRSIIGSLHARIRWAQEGRGTHTFVAHA